MNKTRNHVRRNYWSRHPSVPERMANDHLIKTRRHHDLCNHLFLLLPPSFFLFLFVCALSVAYCTSPSPNKLISSSACNSRLSFRLLSRFSAGNQCNVRYGLLPHFLITAPPRHDDSMAGRGRLLSASKGLLNISYFQSQHRYFRLGHSTA